MMPPQRPPHHGPPPDMDDEPPSKKAKTEESLMPEHEFLAKNKVRGLYCRFFLKFVCAFLLDNEIKIYYIFYVHSLC